MLDAVRLGPADDATAVTAAQLREVVDRLIAAGHWQPGDPDILIVFDAGYDVTRLAYVAGRPARRAARPAALATGCMRLPTPPRPPGTSGRPPKHGPEFALRRPGDLARARSTPPAPTPPATAPPTPPAWDRVHPRLTHRAAWLDHDGELPVIEGTLIRLQVDHLPGDRDPKPVWLWSSRHRRHRRRRGPLLAGVPAPLRPRAHLPAVQADPGLDRPEDPRPRRPPTAGPG